MTIQEIIKKGDKFNRLTAIKFNRKGKLGEQHWLFKCDCGKEKVICVAHVKRGTTKSCGCLHKEMVIMRNTTDNLKHGKCETGVYKSWDSMKQRCLNENKTTYKDYGGRGITICDRWLKFENFFEDMGDRPDGKTLDRIDNNLGYSKSNCRWATRKEQANNTRGNHLLTCKDKTQNVTQWAKELEMNYNTLRSRLNRGWSVEKTLTFNT